MLSTLFLLAALLISEQPACECCVHPLKVVFPLEIYFFFYRALTVLFVFVKCICKERGGNCVILTEAADARAQSGASEKANETRMLCLY